MSFPSFAKTDRGSLDSKSRREKPVSRIWRQPLQMRKATAESLNAKIEETSAAIATDEADLQAATDIRTKEQGAFEAEEKELIEVIGTLERAIGIIEKEMSKSGASMVQLKSAGN